MFGFVTGLTAEARLLAGLKVLVESGGGTPEGAAAATERLIGRGATRLISFGLAGGLDPALLPGALVVPLLVTGASGATRCDESLVAHLGGHTVTSVFAGSVVADSARVKRQLFAATSAAAIDIESGAVGVVANHHDLPFAVLRAIADPASRDLPEAALVALDPRGQIMLGPVVRSLWREPTQLFGLARLARDAANARRSLRDALDLRFPK